MSIDDKIVQKLADLSHLTINNNETEELTDSLNKVLSLVEQMQSVNTDDVTPLAHPLDEYQPTRPDQITESDQRDAFQQLAPKTYAGLYIVPKVIETE